MVRQPTLARCPHLQKITLAVNSTSLFFGGASGPLFLCEVRFLLRLSYSRHLSRWLLVPSQFFHRVRPASTLQHTFGYQISLPFFSSDFSVFQPIGASCQEAHSFSNRNDKDDILANNSLKTRPSLRRPCFSYSLRSTICIR